MIRANQLRMAYLADPRTTLTDLSEALDRGRAGKPGGLRPDDFSIRDLAAALITDRGGEPIGLGGLEALCRGRLLEADGALTTSAFAAVTGQVLNAAVREGYALPEFILSQTIPAIDGRAREARITGVSLPLAEGRALEVAEGEEYPAVGMYDEYVKTPATTKRGAVVRITKEAVLQDETGQILEQARRVGELIGLQKEIALTDFVIGAVANCVIEKRVGDSAETTSNLYLTSGRWINQQTNPLTDWTDIDAAADQLDARERSAYADRQAAREAAEVWVTSAQLWPERADLFGDAPERQHVVYRPGHWIAASRTRGVHHAVVYVQEALPWLLGLGLSRADVRSFFGEWLTRVARWRDDRPEEDNFLPPPRVLDDLTEKQGLLLRDATQCVGTFASLESLRSEIGSETGPREQWPFSVAGVHCGYWTRRWVDPCLRWRSCKDHKIERAILWTVADDGRWECRAAWKPVA